MCGIRVSPEAVDSLAPSVPATQVKREVKLKAFSRTNNSRIAAAALAALLSARAKYSPAIRIDLLAPRHANLFVRNWLICNETS